MDESRKSGFRLLKWADYGIINICGEGGNRCYVDRRYDSKDYD